jgi:hypothetical protein
MSAVPTSPDECPERGAALEDINEMRHEIQRLRAVLHKIAFKTFGTAEDSATRVLVLVTELARETLRTRTNCLQAGQAKGARWPSDDYPH